MSGEVDTGVEPQASERSANGWSVWRQDDLGNRFEVRRGLARDAAERLARELEAGGHKQTYWAHPTAD